MTRKKQKRKKKKIKKKRKNKGGKPIEHDYKSAIYGRLCHQTDNGKV